MSGLAMFYRCKDGSLIRLDAVKTTEPTAWIDGDGEERKVTGWSISTGTGGAGRVHVDAEDYEAIVELLEQRMGIV